MVRVAARFRQGDNVVGIRLSGKTYLLVETMRLEATGVGRQQIVYLNFEDDRLMPIRSRETRSHLACT
jgi:predicted AAA+ superfamily ATPase